MGFNLFSKKTQQATPSNNILDDIKAEPTIKKLLRIDKICNIVGWILGGGTLIFTYIFQFVNLRKAAATVSYLNSLLLSLIPAGIALVIGIILSLVASIAKFKANRLIDGRLNEMAASCGVLDKYPTGKDVKKFKILATTCNALIAVFLIISMIVLYVTKSPVALIFTGLMVASYYGQKLLIKKADNLQDERIKNIIYATAAEKPKDVKVFDELVDTPDENNNE